jgi:transposase
MTQATLMMGPERRRRWRPEEKLAVLAEAFAPGATVAEVSRRLDVATSLIYQWRRQAMGLSRAPLFIPATITAETEREARSGAAGAAIVIDIGGTRISIGPSASAALVLAALRALK